MSADYYVTVCASCLRASCWHGTFPCDDAKGTDITTRRASELHALGREHPDMFSRERILDVCGAVHEGGKG